jgi:hypothetical protein
MRKPPNYVNTTVSNSKEAVDVLKDSVTKHSGKNETLRREMSTLNIFIASQPEPIEDFYKALMKSAMNYERNVKQRIATVEERAKISVKKHLGFGSLQSPIKTKTCSDY